jgi:hypothetical protein
MALGWLADCYKAVAFDAGTGWIGLMVLSIFLGKDMSQIVYKFS